MEKLTIEQVCKALQNKQVLFEKPLEGNTENWNNYRVAEGDECVYLYYNQAVTHSEKSIKRGEHNILFFALTKQNMSIHAHYVGYLNHFFDYNEPYSYYLYKLDLEDKTFMGKHITPYALKFFEEIAHEKGYSRLFLDYRPDGIDDPSMYITNEKGKLEHRTAHLYRINGYSTTIDDGGCPECSKRICPDFDQKISAITKKHQSLVVYQNVKEWKKLQTTQKTME